MARKSDLRTQRTNTVINLTSKQQETLLGHALFKVEQQLNVEFDLVLRHDKVWTLADIVWRLRKTFPNVTFHYHHETSFFRPDGGIMSIVDHHGELYPILITEIKNQGTNDLRQREGKTKQAKGNAIERLGKNVIGFRTAMRTEGIMPFVCFGDGCDFEDTSSILDRVSTIAMFGPLNETLLSNQGPHGYFNRGSFYFRPEPWTTEEMARIMGDIARRSIFHYYSVYGDDHFQRVENASQ